MNATVRKKKNETCIGRHSKGHKSDNGDYLINFYRNNELLLTSTCFKHKQSYLTTWQQTHVSKETNKTQHIRKVLDFIMTENQCKHTLLNAQSYSGTYTISDHRLVVTTIVINWSQVHKKKNRGNKDNKMKI